jgi:flagella basal body P-ring formation protein FlgA
MKGETVTLMAEGEGFSIAAPGRAEDDGYEGDLLAVRNVKSGVVLMGRLASGGVVLVR